MIEALVGFGGRLGWPDFDMLQVLMDLDRILELLDSEEWVV